MKFILEEDVKKDIQEFKNKFGNYRYKKFVKLKKYFTKVNMPESFNYYTYNMSASELENFLSKLEDKFNQDVDKQKQIQDEISVQGDITIDKIHKRGDEKSSFIYRLLIGDNFDGKLYIPNSEYFNHFGPRNLIPCNSTEKLDKIKTIFIPDSVMYLDAGVFNHLNNLTEVGISNSHSEFTIKDEICSDSLKEIWLPDCLKELNNYLFSECNHLETVNIPKSVKRLPDGLFAQCNSLKEITIPDNVNTLGNRVFIGCNNLSQVNISQSSILHFFGDYIFAGCKSLENLYIPKGTEYICINAFRELPPQFTIYCEAKNQLVQEYCGEHQIKCSTIN